MAGDELGTSSGDTDPPPAHPPASVAQGAEVPQVRAGVRPAGWGWGEAGAVGDKEPSPVMARPTSLWTCRLVPSYPLF